MEFSIKAIIPLYSCIKKDSKFLKPRVFTFFKFVDIIQSMLC